MYIGYLRPNTVGQQPVDLCVLAGNEYGRLRSAEVVYGGP